MPGRQDGGETGICHATPEKIFVRGRDLCADLIGHRSFTQFFYFLVTGVEPTPPQTFFLDAVLVSIAEHGLTPSVQASRMTYAAEPNALQAAVAAGILGCGGVVLGTAQEIGHLIQDGLAEADRTGQSVDVVAHRVASDYFARGERIPGFGQPLHRPVDPRTERLFDLADQHGVSGRAVGYARALAKAVAAVSPKPIPLNVQAAIAAVMLDLDFPIAVIRGLPLLARTAGLIAHLAEESEKPMGFRLAANAARAVHYSGVNPPTKDSGAAS